MGGQFSMGETPAILERVLEFAKVESAYQR